MTATTPDLSAALTAICAAIDDGDDSALPILADALEEAGDPRAVGVRRIGDRQPGGEARPNLPGRLAFWQRSASKKHLRGTLCTLPREDFTRLESEPYHSTYHLRYYRTRSAAFLALAAALTAE